MQSLKLNNVSKGGPMCIRFLKKMHVTYGMPFAFIPYVKR